MGKEKGCDSVYMRDGIPLMTEVTSIQPQTHETEVLVQQLWTDKQPRWVNREMLIPQI